MHAAPRTALHVAVALLFLNELQAATLRVNSAGGGKHYATLAAAVRDLKAGDELIIGPGVYREPLDLRSATKLATQSDATTTIRGGGARTVIKGSVLVTDWKPLGDGVFVKRPWRTHSQQVFVDGQLLKQIGGVIFDGYPVKATHPFKKLHVSQGGIWPTRIDGNRDSLSANSFYFDADEEALYIKLTAHSLNNRSVEVSTQPYLLFGDNVRGVVIRDLTFTHANTSSISQSGAVTLIGDDIVLDNITVSDVDGNGADLTGDRNVVKNSIFTRCGIVGLKVRGRRAQVIDNELSSNNARRFNKWWEAGGAKFVGNGGLRDSEVARNRVFDNHGDGLWFDWKNDNNRVHHNLIGYNAGMGIHYEASERAEITDNTVFGNRQRGIYLPNSAHSTIAYNLVVGNDMEGIVIVNERQAEAKKDASLLPLGNRIVGNVIGWNKGVALTVPPESDAQSDGNLFIDAKANRFSMGWASRERPVVNDLAKWRTVSSQDAHSVAVKTEMPLALSRALTQRDRKPDWESLRALRERHRVEQIAGKEGDPRRATAGPSL